MVHCVYFYLLKLIYTVGKRSGNETIDMGWLVDTGELECSIASSVMSTTLDSTIEIQRTGCVLKPLPAISSGTRPLANPVVEYLLVKFCLHFRLPKEHVSSEPCSLMDHSQPVPTSRENGIISLV